MKATDILKGCNGELSCTVCHYWEALEGLNVARKRIKGKWALSEVEWMCYTHMKQNFLKLKNTRAMQRVSGRNLLKNKKIIKYNLINSLNTKLQISFFFLWKQYFNRWSATLMVDYRWSANYFLAPNFWCVCVWFLILIWRSPTS